MNKLQETIFEKCKDTIIKDFAEDEVNEILESYKTYLIERYNDDYDEKMIDKCISAFVKLENLVWNDKTVLEKKSLLIKDEYLAKIGKISEIAYQNANAKNCNNLSKITITKEQADNYIEEMKSYIEQVKSHNKTLAEMQLSEAIIDFQYALGLIDYTSLRIGRMK